MVKLGIIVLDGRSKATVPCRFCGCITAGQYPPVGGQPGNKLICEGCGKFHGWLSPRHPEFIGGDDDVLDDWVPE